MSPEQEPGKDAVPGERDTDPERPGKQSAPANRARRRAGAPGAPGKRSAPGNAGGEGAGIDPEDWTAGSRQDRDDWLREERPPHW